MRLRRWILRCRKSGELALVRIGPHLLFGGSPELGAGTGQLSGHPHSDLTTYSCFSRKTVVKSPKSQKGATMKLTRGICVIFGCYLLLSVEAAIAAEDCTNNPSRMQSIRVNLQFCLNAYGGTLPRHKIIFGRYNPGTNAGMVAIGFDECQKGRPGHDDYDFCNAASLWVAATQQLPPEDFNRYPEASINPDTRAGTAPSQGGAEAGASCVSNDGTCVVSAWPPRPKGEFCSCNGLPGVIR